MKNTLASGLAYRFKVKAHDGVDTIGEGRHRCYVVAWDKLNARVAATADRSAVAS